MVKDGNSRGRGRTAAAMLAGGEARRFGGRDKGTLVIGGARLVDLTLDALRPVADDIVVVTNDPSRYADLGVPRIADLTPGLGPIGGLQAALHHAADATRLVVVACDMPGLTAGFLAALVDRLGDHDAVVPRSADGLHPLCAVYATRIRSQVDEAIAGHRLALHGLLASLDLVEVGEGELARFDTTGLLLANLNTPADYERALARREPVRPPTPS